LLRRGACRQSAAAAAAAPEAGMDADHDGGGAGAAAPEFESMGVREQCGEAVLGVPLIAAPLPPPPKELCSPAACVIE
jgi:hypothetical protein